MGTWASMAMMKPPFLNGSRFPVRLRVPSGKIRNELPSRSESEPLAIDANALLAVAAIDCHEAGDVERRPMIGNFRNSAL